MQEYTSQKSFIRLIHNVMEGLEDSSDKLITTSSYYIIIISHQDSDNTTLLNKWAKDMLLKKQQPAENPLVVYRYHNSLYLLFSSKDGDASHQFAGSHHEICSYYSSKYSLLSSSPIKCRIIELSQQSDVFAYFMWKIHQNMKLTIRRECENLVKSGDSSELDDLDLADMPFKELINLVENAGRDWDTIPDEEKYGKFIRLKKKKKKIVIIGMSEAFDAQNKKRYISYLFG